MIEMIPASDVYWPTDNQLGIPCLVTERQGNIVDAPVAQWGSISKKTAMHGTWHFYTDDHRFISLLKDPDQVIKTKCVSAVEPNFSTFDQGPLIEGLAAIFNKRWIARHWQQNGIRIFVDMNVSPRFAASNLLGVPRGWAAYATRAYSDDRLVNLYHQYSRAKDHAGRDPLFLVYGGGEKAQSLANKLHCVWIPDEYGIREVTDYAATEGATA